MPLILLLIGILLGAYGEYSVIRQEEIKAGVGHYYVEYGTSVSKWTYNPPIIVVPRMECKKEPEA